jgi:hypothetical protein
LLGIGQEAGRSAVPALNNLWTGLKSILNFKASLLRTFNEVGRALPAKVAAASHDDLDFSFFLGK